MTEQKRNEYCIKGETQDGKILLLRRGFWSRAEAEDHPMHLTLLKRQWVEPCVPPPVQKTEKRTHQERLNECFAAIVAAALSGQRCPENGTLHVSGGFCGELAAQGRIKVEVFARNFRVATILTGPHAGLKTAPPPYKVRHPKLVFTKDGKQIIKLWSRTRGIKTAKRA